MGIKSAIVEVTVPFRVTLNQYGEVSSVEPMQLMRKYFDEAERIASEMSLDEFEEGEV